MDALVNTTNKDFHLNAAGVSGAILAAAGSVIQQEIIVNMPANVSAGTILRTSGGNLPVKSIFHGFLGQWNDGKVFVWAYMHNVVYAYMRMCIYVCVCVCVCVIFLCHSVFQGQYEHA